MDFDDLWGDDPDWAQLDDEGEGNRGGGGGGIDDEEDEEEAILAGAHHVIFMLDCHADMFVPCIADPEWPEDDAMSPMDAALKACEKFLAVKLRSVAASRTGKRDGCGILLYGTKNRPNVAAASAKSSNEDDEDEEEDDDDDDDFEGPASRGVTTHVLLPLEPPGLAQYKSIRDCLEDPVMGRERDLQAEYGQDDDKSDSDNNLYGFQQHPLQAALLQANQMFRKAKCVKKKVATSSSSSQPSSSVINNNDVKELWIFTNQDNPTMSKEQVERLLLRTAKDVKENDVEIILWSLPNANKANASFDRHVFFDKLTNTTTSKNHKTIVTTNMANSESTDDSNNNNETKHSLCFDEIVFILDRQRKKMRRLLTAPLFLPRTNLEDSPGIMMDIYRHVRILKKPTPKTIHQQKKKYVVMSINGKFLYILNDAVPVVLIRYDVIRETVTVRDFVVKESGELVFTTRKGASNSSGSTRLRFFAKLGEDTVPLSPQEVREIKQKSNILQKSNGLILWGFKKQPRPFHYSLEPSYFVYPNDEQVKGSTKAFANLHSAMIRKGVVGYGELLTRVTATPRLVEIHAIPEVLAEIQDDDEDQTVLGHEQVSPPGMTLYLLPFQNEVRDIAPDKASEAAEADQADFVSEEAMSAAMELMKGLKVDNVELGERFQNAPLEEFWNYVQSVALDLPMDDAGSSKRQYDTQINEAEILERVGKEIETFKQALPEDEVAPSGSRKRKPVEEDVDLSTYIENLFRKSQLQKATIKNFTDFLEEKGVTMPGKPKKADLIRRVVQYLNGETVSVKEEDDGDDVNEDDGDDDEKVAKHVERMYHSDQLAKCKVSELKLYLELSGEKLTGRLKKDVLLERVSEILSKKDTMHDALVKMEESNSL